MDVYQNACLTLQKLKMDGTQRVLVQYQQVNVGPGGQAMVAGRVSRGSPKRGGVEKMGDEPMSNGAADSKTTTRQATSRRRRGAGPRLASRHHAHSPRCGPAPLPSPRWQGTGPRTPEGLERSRKARWKHGSYSVEAKREFRRLKAEYAAFNAVLQARHASVFAGIRLLMRRRRTELRNARRRHRRRHKTACGFATAAVHGVHPQKFKNTGPH